MATASSTDSGAPKVPVIPIVVPIITKKTAYKLWYILRDDDGFIQEAGVKFYEGEPKDVQVKDNLDNTTKTKVKFVPSKSLELKDLSHLSAKNKRRNQLGEHVVVYKADEVGRISTDKELVAFLKTEIKKDTKREVIDKQK